MGTEQKYPEPTVGALIFNDKDQILLVKTHKWKGKYTIPGGHVELGERLTEALKREIGEETGLNLKSAKFLCYQEFIFDECFWEKKHFIFFDFICRVDGEKVTLNDEAQEFVWAGLEEAYNYPIDDYLRHSLDIIRDSDLDLLSDE